MRKTKIIELLVLLCQIFENFNPLSFLFYCRLSPFSKTSAKRHDEQKWTAKPARRTPGKICIVRKENLCMGQTCDTIKAQNKAHQRDKLRPEGKSKRCPSINGPCNGRQAMRGAPGRGGAPRDTATARNAAYIAPMWAAPEAKK